ncbi:AidA/PixA family protein [Pseudomonas protegens]|uniref:AidA/PixA family protein n=1 Tax=Pseudomonas protegens TaxID=380021 RepID=UPI003906CE85
MNDNIVDILITIDVDTILESAEQGLFKLSQDASTPSQLYNIYDGNNRLSDLVVYMVVRRSNADGADGGSELAVNLRQGDQLRWRATSLSKGLYYSVIIYQYTQTHPPLSEDPNPYLTNVVPTVLPSTPLPIINRDNPAGQPIPQNVKTFYWQADATRVCTRVTYTWSFMIVDRDNKVLGYCSWDPYFSIR